MKNLYEVQHTGKPMVQIAETDWKHLSNHKSADAAYEKIEHCQAYLEPMTWDDNYRIVAPDGRVLDAEDDYQHMLRMERYG
jgi:hypothetical protein